MAPWVSAKYSAVLSNFLDRYKQTKSSQRQELVKEVVEEITALAEEDGVAIPPNLEKKVVNWFQNHRDHSKSSGSKQAADRRLATTWTLRKVVKRQMAAELDALILKKDSAALPGTALYIRFMQECLTDLVSGLSQEEAQKFYNLAEQWNSLGVDAALQAKQADKKFVKVAKRFMDDVYKQMGVHIFMLVGYQNSEGDVVKTKLETDTFVRSNKNFIPIFNKVGQDVWSEWDNYLQDHVEDDGDHTENKVTADKSVPWPLNCDEEGYPILPDIQEKSLTDVKDIVRSFVTLSYRHAANNPKAVVPWSALRETPEKFLEACYLPIGVKLTEISKMKADSLHACLRHWLERAEHGEIAFRFKTVQESDLRGHASTKKRSATPSDNEEDQTNDGHGDQEMLLQPTKPSDDGHDGDISHKGKDKALLMLCPADVPKGTQHQFDFLLTLSKEKEYIKLVEQAADIPVCLLFFHACGQITILAFKEKSHAQITAIPGPKWASWSYNHKHLSGRFHSNTTGFEEFIKWLKSMPYCTDSMTAYPQHQLVIVCLGIGLVLRDLYTIQFELGEGNDELQEMDPGIKSLKKSKLEWAHMQVLLQMCSTIGDDLRTCLDEGHQSQSANVDMVTSTSMKPVAKRSKTGTVSAGVRKSTRTSKRKGTR